MSSRYGCAVWPEPVQRVATFLRNAKAEARLEEFADETPTAEDAARLAGAELAQIVKSLACDCDGRTVVVLVPGDRRADLAKVAAAAGATRARIVRSRSLSTPGGNGRLHRTDAARA
jgi:prolyl-tRNA editing enzyme YbaK/EbsC (Cys-tRNA(Pro) deacylase)